MYDGLKFIGVLTLNYCWKMVGNLELTLFLLYKVKKSYPSLLLRHSRVYNLTFKRVCLFI